MFGFKNRYRKMPDATLDAYAQDYLRIISIVGNNNAYVARKELKKIHKEQERRRQYLLSMWVNKWEDHNG